jgi:hypothetical protein
MANAPRDASKLLRRIADTLEGSAPLKGYLRGYADGLDAAIGRKRRARQR